MNLQQKAEQWKALATADPDLIPELLSMNEEQTHDAFYCDLAFGTGGLRGKIGAGTNRMNVYTVAKATQGLAQYILAHFAEKDRKVAISYDSRIKSDLFARVTASVFAANGIQVWIYPTLMPVPCLSFATRYYHCAAGVMITASHNPSVYNGYKAYGPDGCQITTDAAAEVLSLIESVDPFHGVTQMPYEEAMEQGRIRLIGPDCCEAYFHCVEAQSLEGNTPSPKTLSIVYTPLHGTGLKPVLRVLSDRGFKKVSVVKEQENPDGHFTTCPYPNPEIREAMELGIQQAKDEKADLLFATDPDCDRIGVAAKNKEGDFTLLTGNETGLLLLQYILTRRKALGTMPQDPVMIKTIVTTDLAEEIASAHGVKTINVLTGFKYIGEQIARLEKQHKESSYLFGFEESYGCLVGTYVRDKDAVVASMLVAEMADYYAKQGKSLLDVLAQIYADYGYRRNSLSSHVFEGETGLEKMVSIMKDFRFNTPKTLGGVALKRADDYLPGKDGLPPADVLKYFLEDGSTVVLRPSGTEPKLKVYYSIPAKDEAEAKAKADAIQQDIVKRF